MGGNASKPSGGPISKPMSRQNSKLSSRQVSRAGSRPGSRAGSRPSSRVNSRSGSRAGSVKGSTAGSDDEDDIGSLTGKWQDEENAPSLLSLEDVRAIRIKSSYPLTCPSSPSPSFDTASFTGSAISSRWAIAPARRVDRGAVDSPVGSAINAVCGYQPVVLRRRQHVFVMRHMEAADSPLPGVNLVQDRLWDPSLTDTGRMQARQVGSRLRREGWGVTRIVCCPSRRCVESAVQLVKTLTLMENSDTEQAALNRALKRPALAPSRSANVQQLLLKTIREKPNSSNMSPSKPMPGNVGSGNGAVHQRRIPRPPPKKVTVSFDYGLSEVMNSEMDPARAPNWYLPLEELAAMFPRGCVDYPPSAETVLPPWPENVRHAVIRFVAAIDRISEQFLDENLIIITDAEAVHSSIFRCKKDIRVYNILFGAYSHLQRHVFRDPEDEDERGVGEWKLATRSGTTGIFF